MRTFNSGHCTVKTCTITNIGKKTEKNLKGLGSIRFTLVRPASGLNLPCILIIIYKWAICTMTSFYYFDQNPSGVSFPVLIIGLMLCNPRRDYQMKRILVEEVK